MHFMYITYNLKFITLMSLSLLLLYTSPASGPVLSVAILYPASQRDLIKSHSYPGG